MVVKVVAKSRKPHMIQVRTMLITTTMMKAAVINHANEEDHGRFRTLKASQILKFGVS